MSACDLAALLLVDESVERVGASKTLSFVGFVEENRADLSPWAVEDRAPFFACPAEVSSSGPFAFEVVECDLEPFGIFFDALDDEAAGVQDPGVDVWVADAALFGVDAHLFERGDAFGAERWSGVVVGHPLDSSDTPVGRCWAAPYSALSRLVPTIAPTTVPITSNPTVSDGYGPRMRSTVG